jgi:hypothetical protein
MHNRSFATRSSNSVPSSHNGAHAKPAIAPKPAANEELSRLFHTAVVTSQATTPRDFSAEIHELTQGAPFKSILNAVQQLAMAQDIPERLAAEQLIQTFRKVEQIWGDYLYREGIDRIRQPR